MQEDNNNFNDINNVSNAAPSDINNVISSQEQNVADINTYVENNVQPVIENQMVEEQIVDQPIPQQPIPQQPIPQQPIPQQQIVNNPYASTANQGVHSKKTNNKNLVLLVLVIILCAGLLLYFFVFRRNESNNSTCKKKISEQVKNNLVYFIGDNSLDSLGGKYPDGVKIFDKIDDVTLDLAIEKAINLGDDKDFILKEKIHNYFQEAFNINLKEYPDLICSEDNLVLYKYDKEGNVYRQNFTHPEHPEKMDTTFLDYYVVDAYKKDDIYYIDLLFLYGNDEAGYFVNGKKVEVDTELYTPIEGESYFSFIQGYFRVHIDEFKTGDIYEYGIKKNKDNKYYLYSLEIINKGDVNNG